MRLTNHANATVHAVDNIDAARDLAKKHNMTNFSVEDGDEHVLRSIDGAETGAAQTVPDKKSRALANADR
jgi:hypothetical protein